MVKFGLYLKVEPTGFADSWGVVYEKRKVLGASKDLGLSTQVFGGCCLLRCQIVREEQDFFSQGGGK